MFVSVYVINQFILFCTQILLEIFTDLKLNGIHSAFIFVGFIQNLNIVGFIM